MKRVFAFLLALCLIFCLCACGKDTPDPTDAPTTGSGDPTKAPTDPAPTDPTPEDPAPTEPTPTEPAPATVSVPRILTLTTTRYSAGAVSSEDVTAFTYEGDIATMCVYNGDFLSIRDTYNYKTNTTIATSKFYTDGMDYYCEYDSYGTQISVKCYKNDVLTYGKKAEATYVDGLLMEKKTFYDDGSLTSHFKYEYNSDGQPTAYIEYSPYREGEESCRYTYIYDDQGRLIERISVTYSSNKTLHYYFTYDASGNEIDQICYDDGAETIHIVTTYDDQGQMHEVIYTYKGELRSRGVPLYDDEGYRIGYESYNANGELVYKTAITYEMIEVPEEDAQGAIEFWESMSKRT